MRRILIDEEVCMGCRLCEVHCTVQHSKSKDTIKAYRKEQPRPLSRVRVAEARPISFPVQCQNCENPPCVIACLSGAMYVDEEKGLVMHDIEKCMGCWTCIMMCPYGAIVMDLSGPKNVVRKCDFCLEADIPACVINCPNEALKCGEVAL